MTGAAEPLLPARPGFDVCRALLYPWDHSVASSRTSWPQDVMATAHHGQGSSSVHLGVSRCSSEQEAATALGQLPCPCPVSRD